MRSQIRTAKTAPNVQIDKRVDVSRRSDKDAFGFENILSDGALCQCNDVTLLFSAYQPSAIDSIFTYTV